MKCCGLHLSIALTDDGSVWTWGSNTDSQLGCPDQAYVPDQAASPQPQMRAVAGPQASCSGASPLLVSAFPNFTSCTSAVQVLTGVVILVAFPPVLDEISATL